MTSVVYCVYVKLFSKIVRLWCFRLHLVVGRPSHPTLIDIPSVAVSRVIYAYHVYKWLPLGLFRNTSVILSRLTVFSPLYRVLLLSNFLNETVLIKVNLHLLSLQNYSMNSTPDPGGSLYGLTVTDPQDRESKPTVLQFSRNPPFTRDGDHNRKRKRGVPRTGV